MLTLTASFSKWPPSKNTRFSVRHYLSKDANVATELFSLKAIELIGKGLKTAYHNGKMIDARESVQLGSTMAMVAGMNAHMGLCHAMVMPLCALYHMPHGQACGMVLPHVLAYNEEVAVEKVADIFIAMGMMQTKDNDGAWQGASYQTLDDMLQEVGISARLTDFGYREDHLPIIVRETFKSVQCQFNPRKPSEEDIVRIVRKLI
jgi:alcohol dehydrogenase